MREQLKNYISKEEHLLPTIHLHGLDKLLRGRYDLITAEKAVPKEASLTESTPAVSSL